MDTKRNLLCFIQGWEGFDMKRRRITARFKQNLLITVLMAVLIVNLFVSLLAPVARARTYVIHDGDKSVTYTTFATDPVKILGKAGMELGEYDRFTTEPTESGETIRVQRVRNITIEYHGQTMNVTGFGETVGELLLRLGLEVTGEDMVSHGMDEEIYDGMILRIERVVTVRETYTTTWTHETTYCADASLPEGVEEVITPGVDGEILCTADVTYVNGREAKRIVHTETATKAPVTEIVGIGTGEAAPENPETAEIFDGYIRLSTGEVLTYSGTDTIRATAYTHSDKGCDLITSTGTTVHRGTVAVDPRYIPYGTRMFIVSNDGAYILGICAAEDCGGDIKGDRMDVYFPTYEECRQFGRRVCTIYYLS
jgi:uncharacterized protein YabE (DUF348 family)/3D (Asp-Asp-Asp) domain-containing protein